MGAVCWCCSVVEALGRCCALCAGAVCWCCVVVGAVGRCCALWVAVCWCSAVVKVVCWCCAMVGAVGMCLVHVCIESSCVLEVVVHVHVQRTSVQVPSRSAPSVPSHWAELLGCARPHYLTSEARFSVASSVTALLELAAVQNRALDRTVRCPTHTRSAAKLTVAARRGPAPSRSFGGPEARRHCAGLGWVLRTLPSASQPPSSRAGGDYCSPMLPARSVCIPLHCMLSPGPHAAPLHMRGHTVPGMW